MMQPMLTLLAALTASPSAAKTCNLDEHHHENGGFYIEGIAGTINDEIDLGTGKRADNGTWAPGYYPHGEHTLCTGIYCSEEARVNGTQQYVYAHTCARLRFTYAADSGSTVYELPSQEALDACDFSQAILRGAADAGQPEFDVLYDYDHAQTIYYYASLQGCAAGQKVAVQIVDGYEGNFQQCYGMGKGSSRIQHCDCNFQFRPSTLIDPCHMAFVYGCLSDMPEDASCCPDPELAYYEAGAYVNGGTCIAQSSLAEALALAPVVHHLMTYSPEELSIYDGTDCPSLWTHGYSDAKCEMYKAIQTCDVDPPPDECSYDASWVAWTSPQAEWNYGGYFTDDTGLTHMWTAATPKIVTGAFQALTLMDMGLPAAQLLGTYGERTSAGSNANSVYANGNGADHGDHSMAPHEPELHFLSDPSDEEKALLAEMIDVSPDCSSSNNWCSSFNTTILDMHGWPDLIIAGPLWADYLVDADVRAAAAARGIPVIELTDKVIVPDSSPRFKSFLEMAERFEALATALGADVSTAVASDKANLCREVTAFKQIAYDASQRGVRALAGYMPYGTADPDNGNIGGFIMPPDKNPALMMLEELGMPILHVDALQDSYYEYMIKADWSAGTMSATNLMSGGGRTGGRVQVPYPVDFFLYEPRGALDFTSAAFAAAWPHPAVVAKQYAYFPITSLHYSYRHATDILKVVGAKLNVAQKLNSMETQCTPVDVLNGEYHRTAGLAPGEYACFNPVEYDWCAAHYVPDWQVEATAAGWIPCTNKVAARKRKLARLVDKGARTSVVEKMLSKLGYDHGALKPKTKADQARQQTRRLSQKVAAKVAADDDDEL